MQIRIDQLLLIKTQMSHSAAERRVGPIPAISCPIARVGMANALSIPQINVRNDSFLRIMSLRLTDHANAG